MVLHTLSLAFLMVAFATGTASSAYAAIGEVGGLGQVGALDPRKPPPEEAQPEDAADGRDAPEARVKGKEAKGKDKDKDKAAAEEEEKAKAEAEEKALQPVAGRVPLMNISFRQKRVYYEKSLKQAIANTERRSPGSFYDVVAFVPPSVTKTKEGARYIALFNRNLNAVVAMIQSQGVPAGRIRSKSSYFEGVSTQEITIYAVQR